MRLLTFIIFVGLLKGQALTSGGATTDRENCGSNAVIDNATSLTVAAWVRPTTLTDGRAIISKYRGATPVGWALGLSGTGGNLAWEWYRGTVQNFITSSTPLSSVNVEYFVAATSSGTGGAVHIYTGTRTAIAVEATYGTSSAGTGALIADAARSMFVSNTDGATPALAFQGKVSYPMVFINSILTLKQLQSLQFKPRVYSAEHKFFTILGFNGVGTQPDWTGNANSCAVTGSTAASAFSLGPVFGN